MSDRDPRFVARFWQSLHAALGTTLDFSTAYHPQTDGQTERVNQIVENMLRACVLEFKRVWDEYMELAEFAYNNSYQASIQMAPYDALYGRKCRTPICWVEVGKRKLEGPELVQQTEEKVQIIRERLRIAQSRQKSYADNRRRDLHFEVGDLVYIKVSPRKGIKRFGQGRKLSARYVGHFPISAQIGDVAYRVSLPDSLAGIHNVFHVSMVRKCLKEPTECVSIPTSELHDDLTYEEFPISILDTKE